MEELRLDLNMKLEIRHLCEVGSSQKIKEEDGMDQFLCYNLQYEEKMLYILTN
jgi:hypothetical protein